MEGGQAQSGPPAGGHGYDLALGLATALLVVLAIGALAATATRWARPSVRAKPTAPPVAEAATAQPITDGSKGTTPSPDTGAPIGDVRSSGVARAVEGAWEAPAPAPTLDATGLAVGVEPPQRDLFSLAERMGRTDGLAAPSSGPSREFQLGVVDSFWVHDIALEEYFRVEATLKQATDAGYFWVQNDYEFDADGLAAGAEEFSTGIMPAIVSVFLPDWAERTQGVRLHVLHHQPIRGVAGYYSSSDQFPAAVEPRSNEREMFYINLNTYVPGSYDWLSLLAHEFQHMLHWHADSNESVWANEGLSELATSIAGYPSGSAGSFFSSPDTPLLEWNVNPTRNAADYAASYSFFTYLHGRYGTGAIGAIVAAPENGPLGIESGLAASGVEARFDDVFLDWVVANVVDDPLHGDGRFSYHDSPMGTMQPEPLDLAARNTVGPYAADYFDASEAVSSGRLELSFDGGAGIGLLEPANSANGAVYWSNRGDSSHSRLTRAFDLTGVDDATLRFRLWYELEPNWDYAYYLVSADNGATWQRMATERTTDDNPNGNNYGSGLTGSSGGWVDETLDLSAFAGGPVLVSFDVVTDDAVSLMGVALDDLVLEATHFSDDASDDAVWETAGWLRIVPSLTQRWAVQIVVVRDGHIIRVERPTIPPDGQAAIELGDIPDDARVIVAVSSLTPGTRHPAGYSLTPVSR